MRGDIGTRGKKRTNADFFEGALTPGVETDRTRETFARCEPWTDEARVATYLRELAGELAWSLEAGAEHDVAMTMRQIATTETLSADVLAGIAWHMLRNALSGRDATDYGDPLAAIDGIPGRTRRHYRAVYGQRGALAAYFEKVQRDLDVGGLMRRGRSEDAARRWLRRNPGLHASDAGAPRMRRRPAKPAS